MNRRIVWLAIGAVVAASLVVAVLQGGSGAETEAERTARLSRGVRCPTCQGLSAAESDAKAATAVRTEIARRVDAGESDAEIRRALVDRYGEEILLTPPSSGAGSLVWAVPVAGLVIGGAGLAAGLRRRRWVEAGGAPSSMARRVLVGGAVVVMAAAAGAVVARTAGERLPGEAATGTVDRGPTELLLEARALLAEGQAVQALQRYDEVLEQDPQHPEALAYRGWLVRLAGRSEVGLELVDEALRADPEFADAHLFRGVILLDDLGRPDEAATEIRRYLQLAPTGELAPEAREALTRAEATAA
jgi:cytochrome c-type biogenesis protein CcmH/NrfF